MIPLDGLQKLSNPDSKSTVFICWGGIWTTRFMPWTQGGRWRYCWGVGRGGWCWRLLGSIRQGEFRTRQNEKRRSGRVCRPASLHAPVGNGGFRVKDELILDLLEASGFDFGIALQKGNNGLLILQNFIHWLIILFFTRHHGSYLFSA